MNKLLLLFISLAFLFSCSRDNTKIYGKAVDNCSGAPVGGLKIELWMGDLTNPDRQSLMDTVRTWSDGTYSFRRHSTVLDDNYFLRGNGFRSDYIRKKEDTKVDLSVDSQLSYSYLTIGVQNTRPYDANDSIYIDYVKPHSSSPTYHDHVSYTGISVNTTAVVTIDGCIPRLVNLTWAVTKHGVTTNFSSAVTCMYGGGGSFQINY